MQQQLPTDAGWEMSIERNASDTFALLLAVNFRVVNNFQKYIENASIFSTPSHVLHKIQYRIFSYLSNKFTANRN